jgi:hypothetical protein
MDVLWHDLRYGLRTLVRSPGFTLVALLTLALGIGANAAVFSAVQALLIKLPPYSDAERLVFVWGHRDAPNAAQLPVSLPVAMQIASHVHSFDRTGVWTSLPDTRFTLTSGRGDAADVQYAVVSAELFPLLGVHPT